jgi:hypothetical protein
MLSASEACSVLIGFAIFSAIRVCLTADCRLRIADQEKLCMLIKWNSSIFLTFEQNVKKRCNFFSGFCVNGDRIAILALFSFGTEHTNRQNRLLFRVSDE